MLPALSRILPRLLQRKVGRARAATDEGKGVKDGNTVGSGNSDTAHITILLLDDTELTVDLKITNKARLVFEKVFDYLNLNERQFFGLRFVDDSNQTQWLDPLKSLSSQLVGRSPYNLFFGVKFYAADPCKLNDEITRYQIFLQVKCDIIQGRLPVREELAVELAAYSLQSELGDFNPVYHSPGYVSEFSLSPDQTQEFEDSVARIHRGLRGMVPSRAEYVYLDKVKWLDMYGVDLHPVQGEGGVDYYLGLTPTGVVMYKNMTKVGNYFWPRLTKVTRKGKLFIIRVRNKNNEECTYSFECTTKQACKHLYKCSVEHYSFFREMSASHSYQGTGKLFNLTSKHRYSVRLDKKFGDSSRSRSRDRGQAEVIRRSSRRPERRLSTSESCPGGFTPASRLASSTTLNTEVFRADGYMSGPDYSPRSVKSSISHAVHRTHGGYSRGGGGRDSPTSVHSEFYPVNRRRARRGYMSGMTSGSESEASTVISRRRYSGYQSCASDTEAEFIPDPASCRMTRQHNCRSFISERGNYADSDCDSRHRARHGCHHRTRRRGRVTSEGEESCGGLYWVNENVTGMWDRVMGRGGASEAEERRVRGASDTEGRRVRRGHEGRRERGVSDTEGRGRRDRVYDQRHTDSRSSKSPGCRPPDALAQHFRYVDPQEEGFTEDQLQDIQYTHVETNAALRVKYSPTTRHRQRQLRLKSCSDLNYSRVSMPLPPAPCMTGSALPPDDEAPPPYNDPVQANSSHHVYYQTRDRPSVLRPVPSDPVHQSHAQHHRDMYSVDYDDVADGDENCNRLRPPLSVLVTQTMTAPIIKTRTIGGLSSSRVRDKTLHNSSDVRSIQQVGGGVSEDNCSSVSESGGAGNHAREDSGLDVDSPSSSTRAAELGTPPLAAVGRLRETGALPLISRSPSFRAPDAASVSVARLCSVNSTRAIRDGYNEQRMAREEPDMYSRRQASYDDSAVRLAKSRSTASIRSANHSRPLPDRPAAEHSSYPAVRTAVLVSTANARAGRAAVSSMYNERSEDLMRAEEASDEAVLVDFGSGVVFSNNNNNNTRRHHQMTEL